MTSMIVATTAALLLACQGCAPTTAAASEAHEREFVWRQSGFEDFSRGRFGDAGANTYVSAQGRVELINRWDLNHDGSLDLVFANSHPHVEKLDAAIYWGNGKDFSDRRVSYVPNAGAQRTVAADLDGDGKTDAVVPSYNNGTWSKMPSAVYYGRAGGKAGEPWDVPPFARKLELPTEAAQNAAVTDLDRDGHLDIVFAQSAGFWEYRGSATALQSPSRIYWGSADGFRPDHHTDIEAAGASDVAAADLNRDGWPDLVLANRERAGNFEIGSFVYFGSKQGFSPDRRIELPTRQVNAVEASDVNADGWPDLIFANGLGQSSYVYLNRDGGFTAGEPVELPTSDARDVAVADVNGDGFVDLFFTNHQTAGNPLTHSYLYFGGQDGFAPERRQSFETVGAWGGSIADLNGDRRPEIVVSNYRENESHDVPSYVYWNSSDGFSDVLRTSLFTRGAVGNTVADFNCDGRLDLMFNNTVGRSRGGVGPLYVYWGDPQGRYSPQRRLELLSVEPYGWAAGDLDQDGRNDLVVANQAEIGRHITENFIYWGGEQKPPFDKARRTALVANAGKDAALADLDRDGHLDVLVVNSAKAPGIFIYWGSPEGFVTTRRTELPSTGAGAPTLADLNDDGHLDLVVHGTPQRPARIYFGDGTRNWDPNRGADVPGSENTGNSEVADMNRDGHLDLLLIHRGTAKSYLYYGNGKGDFTPERRVEFSPLECQGVTVADVDQDGWLDVVCPTYKNQGTRATMSRIYLGGRDGLSEQRVIELPTNSGTGSMVADFNRDGFNDVLFVCHRSEGDPDVIGAVSDHVTPSYLYWGGKDGFSADRKQLIPSRGAHYDSGVDFGNITDRRLSFDYVSPPFHCGKARAERIDWSGDTPHGSALSFQVRSAAGEEELQAEQWSGPKGPDSSYARSGEELRLPQGHEWVQYRAILTMSPGGATPSLHGVAIGLVAGSNEPPAEAGQADPTKYQSFDADPGWEAKHNRLVPDPPPVTRQDFGYSATRHAGGAKGEIGGWVNRSSTPAWYAKRIEPKTLNDNLSASGKFAVTASKDASGTLCGWFNESSRGWRTPNSLAFRIDGNRDSYWVFFEYGTQDYQTGGGDTFEGDRYQTTKSKPFPADGTVHTWSMQYDPEGAEGRGEITFVLDGETYTAALEPGHKLAGATFNRFGIFNHQTTGAGMEAYFDDLVLDGRKHDFASEPHWEGRGNRINFADRVRRPLHDFGYAATNRAGGKKQGEIGGVVWRGGEPASYADKVGPFTLEDPLHASGTVAFTAGAADSAASFGFFNSRSHPAPREETAHEPNLLGIIIEGPSRVGHYFRPIYFNSRSEGGAKETGPLIRPDGKIHTWSLDYDPRGAGGKGRITFRLDHQVQEMDLRPGAKEAGATFDRFGLFNMNRGGHYLELWLDDLKYSSEPAGRAE